MKRVNRLGADLIVLEISDPEKLNILIIFLGRLRNLLDVTCWSREERTNFCRDMGTEANMWKLEETPPILVMDTEIHR